MLTSVNFHHQHRVEPHKINDVISKRMLPAKLELSQLLAPQKAPQTLLCFCHVATQSTLQLGFQYRFIGLAFHLC